MTAYTPQELTDEERAQADRIAKMTLKKYGITGLTVAVSALMLENAKLTKEINEHRIARGYEPMETFVV